MCTLSKLCSPYVFFENHLTHVTCFKSKTGDLDTSLVSKGITTGCLICLICNCSESVRFYYGIQCQTWYAPRTVRAKSKLGITHEHCMQSLNLELAHTLCGDVRQVTRYWNQRGTIMDDPQWLDLRSQARVCLQMGRIVYTLVWPCLACSTNVLTCALWDVAVNFCP